MAFYVDGKTVENTEKLEGRMSYKQAKYHATKSAAGTMRIAERRGYGLGECGYYLHVDTGDLIESDIATEREAYRIVSMAEDMMYRAEDLGATLNEPSYWEKMENERVIAKDGEHDFMWDPSDEED